MNLVTRDNVPVQLIEAKRSETRPERALVNFSNRYDIPAMQVVQHLKQERMDKGVTVRRGMPYLESLMI